MSIDDTDHLIRSTSTLLHWVGHNVTEGKDRAHSIRQDRLLDRVTSIFVSGTRPAAVAAAAHWNIDSITHRNEGIYE
ncbi:hypothetical protein M407DRAFT_109850 [Tulasnella calospora MUT 4182]|uniref:Uncharacterized protein n=1 Tax=Tulasnella calospora MUT 4182 TaxID=1051891 RepID=A0A0C3Q3R9_9AGAM|nr:hypothetical protein M407DRAFT_109850 [Tulasnella calospora MUT 4182]